MVEEDGGVIEQLGASEGNRRAIDYYRRFIDERSIAF